MNKFKLTPTDLSRIKQWDEQFGRTLDILEKAKQLSVGDYLVLYTGPDVKNMKIATNSYGAPTKYKVVYSSVHGIPFIKKVNKKGNPVGPLYSCTGALDGDEFYVADAEFEFRLDPDYADSLLLEDNYDPAALHRTKQEIFKEVTIHNKKYKVVTRDLQSVVNFFQNVNIGDMLWTSVTGHFLVQDKESVSRLELSKKIKNGYTRAKGPFVTVLTVLDKNNKTLQITPDFFYYKSLYTQRPRSYKELKI